MLNIREEVARWVVVLACLAVVGQARGARPVVFLTAEQIQEAKERIVRNESARKSYEAIRDSANVWLGRTLEFPQGATGWYHDYFCPEHGVYLRYDAAKPDKHYCSAGDHYVQGEKLDAYWRAVTLRDFVNGARYLATVYAIGGDRERAKAAVRILVLFSDYYEKYVQEKKPRRLMWQTLDEAVYILWAVAAYELVYDSEVLSAEDRQKIEEKWLRPTAEFIRSQTRTIHNIHCWQNSAVLCLGLVLKDKGLVDFAMEDPTSGFRQQIAKGVQEDGLWYEVSFGYHFYTISSLENTIIPAVNNRLDISSELGKLEKMFKAPILCADGQFQLPSPNDGTGGNLIRHSGAYELACFLFPEEERFGQLLRRGYGHSPENRSWKYLLFYGAEELPERPLDPEKESVNLEDSGLAMLRSWRGEECTYAAMDYGPHGGGHGHPDKLNIILSGLGQMFSPDLGSAGYGLKIHGSWYRQSLSHNVVVVGQRSQRPSQGELVGFKGEGEVKWVSAKADGAYPEVEWQRTVFLSDDGYVVIHDSLRSKQETTFDWAYHSLGKLSITGIAMQPTERKNFGTGNGYEVPTDLRHGTSEGEVLAAWQLSGPKRVMLFIPKREEGPRDVFSAMAAGNPSMIRMPMVLLRERGRAADFWAVLEPVEEESGIRGLSVSDKTLTVSRKDGETTTFFIREGMPGYSLEK